MGRRYPYLWRQHSYIRVEESGDPGCIWGILRLLNYHQHWRNVKKIISSKKHGSKIKSKKIRGAKKAIEEANPKPVGCVNPPEIGSVSKRSIKVRIRELIMSKEKNSKCRISYLPEQPELQEKSAEDSDILEIFKVNRQIFLKMLNDSADKTIRLTKSGSFPCPKREWGPCKLEDKQREIWPVTKSMPLLDKNVSKRKSMRRASSLNESMDRYSKLFGSTSVFKRHLSRSLKVMMINENDDPTPKFRRRLSLPEFDYESFLPNNIESAGEACEDVMNQEINEEISDINQGDEENEVAIDCDAQETKEEQLGVIKLPVLEDYYETTLLPSKLVDEKMHSPEFNYVKLVLELSGFTGKEQTWVWYTIEKPLNPNIFEVIEKEYNPFENAKNSIKMEDNKLSRKLIFDLINEALVEIDERSYLYYPRALSTSCHVHPIPKGRQLLEEVWVFVGRCLSWRPELDHTLDFAVVQDFLGRNGWMNLQIESECVALEFEEMIVEELLLDEILVACS